MRSAAAPCPDFDNWALERHERVLRNFRWHNGGHPVFRSDHISRDWKLVVEYCALDHTWYVRQVLVDYGHLPLTERTVCTYHVPVNEEHPDDQLDDLLTQARFHSVV